MRKKVKPAKKAKQLALDVAHPTGVGIPYILKSDHRNGGNGKKSQWKISPVLEVRCFEHAHRSGWRQTLNAWGLHLPVKAPAVLGVTVDGEDVKLAKFLSQSSTTPWHGYPADYRRNPQDRPAVNVLQSWRTNGLITLSDVARVRRGRRCSLSS
jgi:hypothetical protein